jgi:hypothetical protein
VAFSHAVRQKALLAAARRCCICRRYRGVLIEVHHIVPASNGGTDDLDNAVPLCFDCHAWAGHFFAGHPRGTAYSPSELRKARDDWYSKVERGEITAQTEESSPLHVRYFLCRDWQTTARVLDGDLTAVPVERALLPNTPAARVLKELVALQQGHRPAQVVGDAFPSIEEFRKARPNAVVRTFYPYVTATEPGYAFYGSIRGCSVDEISGRVLAKDPLSQYLAAKGAPLNELSIAVAENGDCGDGSMLEMYRVRPIWALFVAIKNIADKPIAVESICGLVDVEEGFRHVRTNTAVSEWRLPPCEILQGEAIFAPIGVLVAPLEELGEKTTSGNRAVERGDYSEVTNLVSFPDKLDQFWSVGPRIRPKGISMRVGSSRVVQDVHDFDLENIYTMDRFWHVGSCPHLFFVSFDYTICYARELLSAASGSIAEDSFLVPAGIKYAIVAELEDETTYLDAVLTNGVLVAEKIWMRQGQFLCLSVSESDAVHVRGAYFSQGVAAPRSEAGALRNRLVCEFIANRQAPQMVRGNAQLVSDSHAELVKSL